MSRGLVPNNHPTYSQIHSGIPKIVAGLVIWFVLMAWLFFDRQSLVGLPLALITALFVIAGLAFSASFLVWYRHQPEYPAQPHEIPFKEWRSGNFAVWGSQQSAGQAATEILLPIAAAAFGITAIGIVYTISASMVS
jgi:hypothetical protein